jgi:hypothetical protein
LILAVAGGAFFYSQPGWGTQESPPPVAATPPAVQQTPVLPPAVIPQNGVWVKVAYNGSYIGSVGNPGSLDHVGGSGDRFFRIRDSEGLVQASFQKQDYSGKTLALEVYRDGEMVCNRTVRFLSPVFRQSHGTCSRPDLLLLNRTESTTESITFCHQLIFWAGQHGPEKQV